MRASTALLALGASLTSAQYYANQSAPFYLQLSSSNTTVDGAILASCHEGAAIEGLCLGGGLPADSSSTYYLNYTTQQTPDPVLGYTGLLTWVLHGGNFELSSPLSLQFNPTSNVAAPLFTPSDNGQQVGFDQDGYLYIPGSVDDTVSPPKYTGLTPLYQWNVCYTNFGYFYKTLVWVVGKGAKAQNPTCVDVKVKRVFI